MALLVLPAGQAAAQERPLRISTGYAFSQYLGEGGGSTPFGAYLSVASAGKTVGFEADVAIHLNFELATVIAGVGPRFEMGSGNTKKFFHVLAGLRYDSVEGEPNTAFGGIAGAGVDIPAGGSLFVRLGADFQIFFDEGENGFDEGENVKTLRLVAGISF